MASFSDIELEPELVRGIGRGDRQALDVLYRRLAPVALGLATRILQDHGLAQEAVQDTFADLLERSGSLRDAGAVVAWVRRVTVNHCLMRLRSPWHHRRLTGEPAEPVDVVNGEARCAALGDLERALARLPPETRLVIWLHDVEGYTHREIGELTGRTASYSKSQMARGYQKLLLLLGGERGSARDLDSACAP